ncbi:MAG: hypothetical protein DSO04_05640 [Hadesarchaea archaeon]|nr:MAG: hypothetical protein DSO04_05640 [Hadesarchaea archaeon]
MGELRDLSKLGWYLELLAFVLVGLGVVLLGTDVYVMGANQQLSEVGAEVEGVEETLTSAAALLMGLGMALVVCGAGCWCLGHRIQVTLQEAAEDLREMEVRKAARQTPRE